MVFAFLQSAGQVNMVPNPSFEDTNYCPQGIGWILASQFWYSPSTSTPDYFNVCANIFPPGSAGVPTNNSGYQIPRTGEAYAGFVTYALPGINYREYISTRLIDTLKPGRHCVSFYVCLANRIRYASNNLGAYFSPDSIYVSTSDTLPYVPQYNHPVIIADSVGWVQVYFEFQATGNELFMTIGNFKSWVLTDTLLIDGNPSTVTAYYYIDDVSVVACPDTVLPAPVSSELFIPTAFSPNNDGNNDVLHVRGPVKEMDLYIYDRWGELVWHGTDPAAGWDGKYKGQLLNTAVFTYYFRGTLTNDEVVTRKGNVTLVR